MKKHINKILHINPLLESVIIIIVAVAMLIFEYNFILRLSRELGTSLIEFLFTECQILIFSIFFSICCYQLFKIIKYIYIKYDRARN
jgi:hypothetical protein